MSTHTEPVGLLMLFTQDVLDPPASTPLGLLLLFSQVIPASGPTLFIVPFIKLVP